MAASNAAVVATQLEKVRPKLQELFETSNTTASLIKKKAESHRISAWGAGSVGSGGVSAFRIPIVQWRGGDYGTFSYDEGDLGSGSSQNTVFMTTGYFPTRLAIELSSLEYEATATSQQAVTSALKYQLANVMKELQTYDDTTFHQDGTGIIATGSGAGSPAGTNPSYNLEPNFGAQRLRLNQPVDIYSNDGTTQRGTGLRVNSLDVVNKTVSLTGTVTGPTNTDRLAFAGMSPTLAVGSWKNGIYTFNNSATSGNTLGLSRTTVSELVTPNVNAGGAGLVPAFGLQLNDYLIARRDEDALKGLVGLSHMSQRAAYFTQGIAISEWHRGPNDKMFDIVPSQTGFDQTWEFCGINYRISKKQDRSRLDQINPSNWGRVMLHDTKFFEVEGRKTFELRSSSGTVKTGILMYLVQAENFYCVDPGAEGMIYGLSLPTGY